MMISMSNLKERVRRERHDTISALLLMANMVSIGSIVIILALGLTADLVGFTTNSLPNVSEAMVGLIQALIPISAYVLGISIGIWAISKLISKVGK